MGRGEGVFLRVLQGGGLCWSAEHRSWGSPPTCGLGDPRQSVFHREGRLQSQVVSSACGAGGTPGTSGAGVCFLKNTILSCVGTSCRARQTPCQMLRGGSMSRAACCLSSDLPTTHGAGNKTGDEPPCAEKGSS